MEEYLDLDLTTTDECIQKGLKIVSLSPDEINDVISDGWAYFFENKEISKDEYKEQILQSLKWIGIQHDKNEYIQSSKLKKHVEIANKLLEKEILFQNDLEKLIGKRPFESKSIIEEDNKRENKNDNSSTKEE